MRFARIGLLVLVLFLGPSSVGGAELPGPLYRTQWGSAGSGNGQFDEIGSIAIAPDGRVYVADPGNSRIQVFNEAGTYITSIVPTFGGQAVIPDGLAISADSSLFVMDRSGYLQKYNRNHQKLGEWSSTDNGGALPADAFERIAASPNYLYMAVRPAAADTNALVLRMNPNSPATGYATFNLEDPAQYQIIEGTDALATDIHDNLYAIIHYRINPVGSRLGEMRRFSSSGTLLEAWALPDADYLPNDDYSGIVVDRAGAIIYLNVSTSSIDLVADDVLESTFHEDGGAYPNGALSSPGGLAADSLCGIFVTDTRERVIRLSVDQDDDGLCDSWERDGISIQGSASRIPLSGAEILRKDLYVEFDYMDSCGFDSFGVFSQLRTIYNQHDITLHIDVDETLPRTGYADSVWTAYRTTKSQYFGTSSQHNIFAQNAKELAYRYCVFADTTPSLRSGLGEVSGNDMYIVLGRVYRARGSLPTNVITGALAHELGHTLGLKHGGIDDINRKPNYISVMNYTWQMPSRYVSDIWSPTFSGESLGVQRESLLIDAAGVTSHEVPYIPIAPWVINQFTGLPEPRLIAADGRRIDWDKRDTQEFRTDTCDTCDINTFPGEKRTWGETLRGYNDWARLKLIERRAKSWQSGVQDGDAIPDGELSSARILADLEVGGDCNGNDSLDFADIRSGRSLDADHDMIPDECETPRVHVLADTLMVCPGGDADSVSFDVNLEGVYEVGSGHTQYARIDSLTAGMVVWSASGGRLLVDSTFAESIPAFSDSVTGDLTAHFAVKRISGCGRISLSVFTGDSLAARDVRCFVRSYDLDAHALGSVDRFDSATLFGWTTACCLACGNFDDTGGSHNALTFADVTALDSHRGHSIPRKLKTPNNVGMLAPGETMFISWVRSWGDSARVTLRLLRDSTTDTTLVIPDLPDTGSYSWVVPDTLTASANYRVEVLHSAGYYKVDRLSVGQDRSDTTFAILPVAVSDLQGDGGKTTAVAWWTEPGQAGGDADAYEIRSRMSEPVTEANWASSTAVGAPAPGAEGTPHCVSRSGLTSCRAYYFGIKTRKGSVWSRISNVVAAYTDCSGSELVICDEEALVGGGGGGEEEGGHVLPSARGEAREQAAAQDVSAENSMLWGTGGEDITDLYQLPMVGFGGEQYRVRLRETGGQQAAVDLMSLGVSDHGPETVAIASADSVFLGTLGSVLSATDPTGKPIPGPGEPLGDAPILLRAGQHIDVTLGPASTNAALVIEAQGWARGTSADSVGILVQRPEMESGWVTIGRSYPRREFSYSAVASGGSGDLRLVFLRDYALRSIGKLSMTGRVIPELLELTGADHSRTGDVGQAIRQIDLASATLVPGDTLNLEFAPTAIPAGKVRDFFLLAKGSYSPVQEDAALQLVETKPAAVEQSWSFALGAARPNPSMGGITFGYTLAHQSPISIRVYDVAGRQVRSLIGGQGDAGPHEVVWDATNDHGRRVAPGVYFYRMVAAGWRSEKKVVIIQP